MCWLTNPATGGLKSRQTYRRTHRHVQQEKDRIWLQACKIIISHGEKNVSVIELSVRPHTACSVTHSPARCSQSEKTRRSIINIQDGVFLCEAKLNLEFITNLRDCVKHCVLHGRARCLLRFSVCVRECQCADVHVHLQPCAIQPCYPA